MTKKKIDSKSARVNSKQTEAAKEAASGGQIIDMFEALKKSLSEKDAATPNEKKFTAVEELEWARGLVFEVQDLLLLTATSLDVTSDEETVNAAARALHRAVERLELVEMLEGTTLHTACVEADKRAAILAGKS